MVRVERCTRRRQEGRRGSVTVEFAIVATLLVPLVVGMFEVGRGITVKSVLADAVRMSCRTASLSGSSNATVTTDIKNILTDNSIAASNATITIQVNDKVADVSTAKKDDKITVQVSLPVSKVYPSSTLFLSKNAFISEACVMARSQ